MAKSGAWGSGVAVLIAFAIFFYLDWQERTTAEAQLAELEARIEALATAAEQVRSESDDFAGQNWKENIEELGEAVDDLEVAVEAARQAVSEAREAIIQ